MAQSNTKLSTLERLRTVAAELFAKRGYGGTSMSDIASRVGVRKASLYNYYASKEALLMELLEGSIETWREASRPALEGPGTLEQRLWRHLRAVVEFTAQHPHEAAIVRLAATQIGGKLGRRVQKFLMRYHSDYVEQLAGLIEDARKRGEVEVADAVDVSLLWRAFVDGLIINQLVRAGKWDPFQDRLDALWALLWRGVSGQLPEETPEP
jgi:AcrR family transcriptional regulator